MFSKKVYITLGLALTAELAATFLASGVVEGISSRADNMKVYARASRDDETILPGDITDRNGVAIVQTTEEKTTYKDRSYSQLVGYTGKRKLNLLADSADEVVGSRKDYRLMAFLDDDSFWGDAVGLYNTTDIDGTKGQTVQLTIDDELQTVVADALAEQVSESSEIGSAVVMDAKTGEILAMVSFPDYDLNDLTSAKQQMLEDGENTNLEPSYPVSYKNSMTPGSIFKILTSVALIDHGMEDFTVANTPFTVNGWTCYGSAYSTSTLKLGENDPIDMETALNISSNIYFSQAALALGKDALAETAAKFMLTESSFTDLDGDGKDDTDGHTEDEDSTCLLTDFGNIQYNFDLDVSDDVLAQTGFGQGRTELTTVYAAMIVQAIANDGQMMKPWMIRSVTDADGKVVYQGESELLSEATGKSTADKVTSYLRSTAKECCNLHNLDSVAEVFDKYKVCGKTGTAENGDAADTNNAWYVSFAPESDPEYVVVVNQCRTSKAGYRMMSVAADIYQYLFGK